MLALADDMGRFQHSPFSDRTAPHSDRRGRRYVFTGVRPSPGAARQTKARAFEEFNAPESLKVAAAEDGRTPLTTHGLRSAHAGTRVVPKGGSIGSAEGLSGLRRLETRTDSVYLVPFSMTNRQRKATL
jgi:hypothetical protein